MKYKILKFINYNLLVIISFDNWLEKFPLNHPYFQSMVCTLGQVLCVGYIKQACHTSYNLLFYCCSFFFLLTSHHTKK